MAGLLWGDTASVADLSLLDCAASRKIRPSRDGFPDRLTSDVLFSDLLGGRATTYIAVVFIMSWRRQKLLQGEFRDIWVEFAATVTGVVLFQLVIFSALNLAIPSLTPVAFKSV